MTGDSDNSLEGPPAPLPSRNASHTSLCSLDLSRDGFGPSVLVNRPGDSPLHPLRRAESSLSGGDNPPPHSSLLPPPSVQ